MIVVSLIYICPLKGDLLLKRKALLLLCAVLAAGTVMYGCGTQNVNTASSNVGEPTSQAESQASSATSSEVSEQPMNDNITLTDTTNETERTKLVYPTVSQMDDASVEEKVNQLIQTSNQLGPQQYSDTANLEGTVEVTFLDGETLSLVYRWTLTNPEENTGYPTTYLHSLVIDLKTGEQKHFNDYASVYNVFYQLKYGLYQIVADSSESDTTARVAVQNLLRNGTVSADKLATADYPLSEAFPPSLFGYVTQDKIGLLIPASDNIGGSIRLEFDRKDVAKTE